MKVLFICSSNICRSPYAEFQFKKMVNESDVLSKNIESITSSAVFNQSRAMHPKTYKLLLKEGFEKEELDSFKPDYVYFNPTKFKEADIIIGMGWLQTIFIPFKFRKKFMWLSEVAVGKKINIPDPFYRKSDEFYNETMNVIKTYLEIYAKKLTDEFIKKSAD